MAKKMIVPGQDLLQRVMQGFLDHGYGGLSMVGLAGICGFTQRALYYYFNSKDDAFRAAIRFGAEQAAAAALAQGDELRRQGGSALDILALIIDQRFDRARRSLAASPHGLEITTETQRRCGDIVIQANADFHAALERLIAELQAEGQLNLNGHFSAGEIAQTLIDSGRAILQAVPPIPLERAAARSRKTCEMVLYGCAMMPAA